MCTLIVDPYTMDPINLPKLTILGLGIFLLFLQIIRTQSTGKLFNFRQIDKFAFGLILLMIIWMSSSAFANSQSSAQIILGEWARNNGILSYFFLSILFLLVSVFQDKKFGEKLVFALAILGVPLAFFGVLQRFAFDPLSKLFPWYNPSSSLALTLGNSNFASVMLAVTFTATLGSILASRKNTFRITYFLVSLLLHIYLITYIDTQGKIAYAVGALSIITFSVFRVRKKTLSKLKIVIIFIIASISIQGLMGLAGRGIFASMLSNNIVNLEDRYFHWLAAIRMIEKFPLFGVGIDSFGLFYRDFRYEESIALRGSPMPGTNNAHNLFLQFGATGGIPLMILYISLVLYVTWRGVQVLKVSNYNLSVSTLISLWFTLQVQSLVSIDNVGLSIWNWMISGTILLAYNNLPSKSSEDELNVRYSSQWVKGLTHLLKPTLVVVLGLNTYLLTHYFYEKVIFSNFKSLGDSVTLIEKEERAKTFYLNSLKSNRPGLSIKSANYLGQAGFVDEALELAKHTSIYSPRTIEAWDIIASIYESRDEKENAVKYRQKTVELDPLNVVFKDLLRKDLT